MTGTSGAPAASAATFPGKNDLNLFLWMDFSRTAAAFLVAISHARDIMMEDYAGSLAYAPFYGVTGFGHSGVIIFFVLSGFWISRSVMNRLAAARFWRDYIIDRLSRLMIVLVPALVLGGALDYIGAVQLGLPLYNGASGSHSLVHPVTERLAPEVFLGNLTFLQTILVPTWGSNGPLWSLAFEFWFYVWFAAVVLLLVRRKLSFALLSLAVGFLNPAIAVGFASWLIGFGLLQLGLGAPPQPRRAAWRFAAGGLLVFLATLLVSATRNDWWNDVLLAAGFGALLYALGRVQIPFPAILAPAARFGRESSYSLYMIHFPILALAGSLVTRGVRQPAGLESVCAVIGLSLGTVVIAWIFSRLTERHTGALRAMLRRLFKLDPIRPFAG